MNGRALRKAFAVAALLAVVVAFTFEGLPHRHVSGVDDRGCPACQAARQHVSDAPRNAALLAGPPEPVPPRAVEPAVERLVRPPTVSSASPRSPPDVSA